MLPLWSFCPYCGAMPGNPCRDTMLPYRPAVDCHPTRIVYAQGSDE
jgi:hypothetical protein